MMLDIKNIKSSPKTTIAGIVIGVASLVSHFVMGTSWGDVMIPLGLSLVLLGIKDPKKQ